MRNLDYKVERKLKNINILFDTAELLATNKIIDIKEIKDLVMPEIIRLANLFENFKERASNDYSAQRS